MAAPSTGNQQSWEFYVVTDKAKIQELSKSHIYAGCAAKAPVVIVPCYQTEGLWAPMYTDIDLALATENMMLEITTLGLGGVILGVAPLEDRIVKVGEILNIREDLRAFAMIPLGYPAENRTQPDRYDASRVHFIS